MVAFADSYTHYDWKYFKTQISERIPLIGGKPYYFEARYREYGGADWVQVGVVIDDVPVTAGQIEGAYNEVQRISVLSDVESEQQVCITS